MITKERLKELIEKGATIWHIQSTEPQEIILDNNEHEWFALDDDALLSINDFLVEQEVDYAWLFENLYETEEEARKRLEELKGE